MLQVFMALIIIGGLAYTLLNDNYKTPMETNMSNLNDNISSWTTTSE